MCRAKTCWCAMANEAVVARARALLGTRFCFQGQTPDGVDCVGLVALACGVRQVPDDYGWRGDVAGWIAQINARLIPRCAAAEAGDILAFHPGPATLHLGIWSGTGLIHAHASLRRVVETPGLPDWPQLGCWCPPQEDIWQRWS